MATVLSELADRIVAPKLAAAAAAAPIVWAQRLGYLMELIGASDRVGPLHEHVREHARDATPLVPGRASRSSARDGAWKFYVNATVEPQASHGSSSSCHAIGSDGAQRLRHPTR